MKFLAYIKQKGEGCDYTIGCGQTMWVFEADSWEAAIEKVRLSVVDDEEGYWTESKQPDLDSVMLVEAARIEGMPIVQWYDEAIADRERRKREAAEKEEQAQHLNQKKNQII